MPKCQGCQSDMTEDEVWYYGNRCMNCMTNSCMTYKNGYVRNAAQRVSTDELQLAENNR